MSLVSTVRFANFIIFDYWTYLPLQQTLWHLYTNTVLDGSVTLSVILSVRYRNHFPVVRFQNQAHIWNPHGTGQVFKTIWGAAGTP